MSENKSLSQRVTDLENDVRELKRRTAGMVVLGPGPSSKHVPKEHPGLLEALKRQAKETA